MGETYGDWYKWGKAVLYLEMVIAILVTVFSLYMAFNGQAAGIA
ncbi:hypothetical protein ACOZ4L_06445 [Haloplanus ruber]|uniref:Uncharacterized protein n=1 Tax=Haloplanus ruber TaxID=869892 RepID=A0ABD6CTJ6_9EURY|nr:hypothetical protein [Haloplanus ruber]